MWFFLVLGFTLEEKIRGKKCCKYFRPEGVSDTPTISVMMYDHQPTTIDYDRLKPSFSLVNAETL